MANSDLLTTKQAAVLLGCSRQHVVDLCESGRLLHVRIGTHRRIRRADVEAVTTTRTLRREELRSLWLHRAVAGKVVADPDRAIATARRNISRFREIQPRARTWLDAWDRILDAGPERVLETLTSSARDAIDLRQNTPFAGLLNEQERLAILSSFAANYTDHSTQ
jgi:excisionase family DNA binding protein